MENNTANPTSNSTQDRLRNAAHGVVDKAIDATAPAAQWLDSKKKYLSDEQKQLADYVSSNTVKALAITFVVGFLIGRITS